LSFFLSPSFLSYFSSSTSFLLTVLLPLLIHHPLLLPRLLSLCSPIRALIISKCYLDWP
jgi:hypothetical protein